MPQSKQHSSWDQIRNLLNCKQLDDSNIHYPSSKNLALLYTSCSKICTLRDVVVPGNTRVAHRDDKSPAIEKSGSGLPSSRHSMQLRKLSRCYESRSVVDPSKPPLSRINVFSCSECKEIFPKIENLELHQAVKHAGAVPSKPWVRSISSSGPRRRLPRRRRGSSESDAGVPRDCGEGEAASGG